MSSRTMVVGGLIGLLLIGGIVGASLLVLDPGEEPSLPGPTTKPPTTRPPRSTGPEELPPEAVAAIQERANAKAEPKPVDQRPAIRFETYGPALDAIEWQPVADTFWRLSRDLPRLGVALTNRGLDVALSKRLDALRMSVADFSIPLRKSFPGEGTTSSWSHTAVLANIIAKTLEAAGEPLTDDQLERVRVLGEIYLERETLAAAEVTNRGVYLSRTVPQVRVRTAFLAEVRGLLEGPQRKVVGGGPFKSRIGLDPFAPGNIWVWEGEVIPLPADLPKEIEHTVFGMMSSFASDGTDERDAAIRAVVAKWIAGFDPAATSYRAGPLSFHGHLEAQRAIAAAESTGELVASVLASFEIEGDRGFILAHHRHVLAPLVIPSR